MTRITCISLCLLLGGLYGCNLTKPKVIVDDRKDVEVVTDSSVVHQDTVVEVISPPVVTAPETDTTGGVTPPTVANDRRIDTLLFQAAELFATTVGQRNPLGVRQGSMEVKVPVHLPTSGPDTKDSLIAIAYWIGIGEPPISAYEALAEEVPTEWRQAGISAPLAAYGQGHPIVLPGLNAGEERFQREQVRFDFVGKQDRVSFAKERSYSPLFPRDAAHSNYGIVGGAQLQRLKDATSPESEMGQQFYRFYFAYANQHQIDSYRVQLRVVGVYGVDR